MHIIKTVIHVLHLLNTAYPHLGATPDGIVQCMCCGKGVVEVKCPHNCKDKSLKIASDNSLK